MANDRYLLPLLTLGVFVFFGIHNYLQEAIMDRPGFTFGWALGLFEMLGTCGCSLLERIGTHGRVGMGQLTSRREITVDYFIVATCLTLSSSLSNISLDYINYPTKVIFRSSKLIPTMGLAIFIHRTQFNSCEWLAAVAVCIGLVFVGVSDSMSSPNFSPFGITLVSLSVFADSIMPNVQQRLFQQGEQRSDVVYITNVLTSIAMTLSLAVSGSLSAVIRLLFQDKTLALYMAVYTIVAYFAVSMHMTVVQKFGGVTGVFVGNARKIMTIILSFVLFPKPVTTLWVLGAVLSISGLTWAVLLRDQRQNVMKKKPSHNSMVHVADPKDPPKVNPPSPR